MGHIVSICSVGHLLKVPQSQLLCVLRAIQDLTPRDGSKGDDKDNNTLMPPSFLLGFRVLRSLSTRVELVQGIWGCVEIRHKFMCLFLQQLLLKNNLVVNTKAVDGFYVLV